MTKSSSDRIFDHLLFEFHSISSVWKSVFLILDFGSIKLEFCLANLPLRCIIVKTKWQICNVNKKIKLHYNYGAEQIQIYFRCIERPNRHVNLKMQDLISTAKLSRKAFMICAIFVTLFSPLHCFNGFDFYTLHTFLVAI